MVLKRFLVSPKRIEEVRHSVPAGERIYAIGDIHGRRDLLDRLLARIDEDDEERGPARTSLIFLGDLVDRGPDSRQVVERLIAVAEGPRESYFLLGNHEEIFLRAVNGDAKAARLLIRIGGRETMLSYGISPQECDRCNEADLAEILRQRVPADHVAFLRTFRDWVEKADYLFVHAGIRPGIPIEEQSAVDLRWIRDEFLQHRAPHARMVVHGHSISEGVEVCSNRIGIDTGAYSTGRLTALGLAGVDRWFLST